MDFGSILDKWELKNKKDNSSFERMLDGYLPEPGDSGQKPGPLPAGPPSSKSAPQRTLDLHGLNVRQALERLEAFMGECRRAGLQKVLIIHGKGHHSGSGPVLKRAVRAFLEKYKHAGAIGTPKAKWGGSGAVWVNLKK